MSNKAGGKTESVIVQVKEITDQVEEISGYHYKLFGEYDLYPDKLSLRDPGGEYSKFISRKKLLAHIQFLEDLHNE